MNRFELMKLGLDEATAILVEEALAREMEGWLSPEEAQKLRSEAEVLKEEARLMEERHQQDLCRARIEAAVRAGIRALGAKNERAVWALIDFSLLEEEEGGGIKGLDEQLKALREAKDSCFLFAQAEGPVLRGIEIGEDSYDGLREKMDLTDMSYEELCSYFEG